MNKLTRTQRFRNENSYKLSAVLDTKYLRTLMTKGLRWPEKSVKPTNRVEKSRQSKHFRTINEPNSSQKYSYANIETLVSEDHPTLSQKTLRPLELTNVNRVAERSKSKKKIGLTNRAKCLDYTHPKPQNDVYDYIQQMINRVFSNTDGCNCPDGCASGQRLVLWGQSYKTNSTIYSKLRQIEPDKNNQIQIHKDISRTQPHVDSFKTPKYLKMLQSVLQVYSLYDKQVGYVQGMNIIVSGLLYHIKQQESTFWVFCRLMGQCQVRKLFLKDFESVYDHLGVIKKLVEEWINDLYLHLAANQVHLEQVCFSWVLTLMSVLISVDYIHYVFQGFIKEGWTFLYKLILAYFLYLKQNLMQQYDSSGLFIILSVGYGQSKTKWKEVIHLANTLKLNHQ